MLCPEEQCNCNDHVQFMIQCKHEYCIDKRFDPEKFDFQHFQVAALLPHFWRYIDGKEVLTNNMKISQSTNDSLMDEDDVTERP